MLRQLNHVMYVCQEVPDYTVTSKLSNMGHLITFKHSLKSLLWHNLLHNDDCTHIHVLPYLLFILASCTLIAICQPESFTRIHGYGYGHNLLLGAAVAFHDSGARYKTADLLTYFYKSISSSSIVVVLGSEMSHTHTHMLRVSFSSTIYIHLKLSALSLQVHSSRCTVHTPVLPSARCPSEQI